MKLTDEDINNNSHAYISTDFGQFFDVKDARRAYVDGQKKAKYFYESMFFDSELAIMLSRHVHNRCGDNVPHDIGLTLLEVIKNYKKNG